MNDRAKIASEQLAALVLANAESGFPCTNDQLTNEAIALSDLLLSKLEATAPIPSNAYKASWSRTANLKPNDCDPCWVAACDVSMGCVTSVQAAVWRESIGWCDESGALIVFGSFVFTYWQHLSRFDSPDSAYNDFVGSRLAAD